jgi:xanthine dehydrogenase accessory factor
VLRGLIRPGIQVTRDMKIGDVDRRNDPAICVVASDKAMAVGGAVLEALLVFMKRSESGSTAI